MKKGFVSIIIPSYNEASNIKLIYESLRNEFQSIDYDYEIYYINDGSTDRTLEEIKKLAKKASM